MRYVIQFQLWYVFGFSCQGQGTVVMCDTRNKAKQFPSRDAAQKFIDTYADAGYGLDSATASILPL